MIKAVYSFIVCGMLLCACGNTKVAANKQQEKQAVTEKRKIACGNKHLAANRPHIDWMIEDKKNIATTGMPDVFDLYSIDEKQLKGFFEAAQPVDESTPALKTLIPLPGPVGCKIAQLQPSQTMSEELKKKYPQMVSLKGGCVGEDVPCDIRLDYDGKVMNGQVIWNSKVYLISPVASGGKTYYMIYDKADAGMDKQPFETK